MNKNDNLPTYTALTNRLKALGSIYTKNKAAWGILVTLSLALGFAFLGLWLNSIFVFPVEARVGYMGIASLILVIFISYLCLRPILYKPSLESLALKLEEKFPELNNRLIAALQLSKNLEENPEGYSTDMIEAVVEQADTTTQKLNLQEIVDRNPIKKMGKLAGSLAIISLFFALVFPTAFTNSLFIFSHPLTEFVSPQKFSFVISPGNAEVVKYSNVKIKINVEGEKPKKVNFYWRNVENPAEGGEGAKWNEERLVKVNKQTGVENPDFYFDFKEVKRSFDYYAEAEGVQSDLYKITVVDKPRVIGLRLTFNYPRYTQLKTQVVDENDGNINAIVGTKVQIEAKTNKELSEANIIFPDSTKSQMKIKGEMATGEILVKKDDSYHIEVWDKLGNKNQDPIEYKITKIDDQYPTVEILEPGHDQDLTENMRVPLLINISDDYGFSSLSLSYQIISEGKENEEKRINIDIPNTNRSAMDVEYLWNLSNLPLVPGDVVKYKAIIFDNDTFLGPKKAESKTYSVRLPSLDEIVAEVEKEQEGQVEDLETVLKGQRELKKKVEDLSRELDRPTGKLDLDWQKKQQMEDILEKQQNLASDLKNLAQRMDENIQKIEENKLAALEMVEKLSEIRKLMEEIMTPEMKEALQKLAEALKNLDPELLKQAVEKMKISQEELLKRLDRTIALLKRMQAEQKLENLIKMAERMTQTQNEINQNTEASEKEKLPELSDQEKELKQDLNNFEEKLKEFADLANELSLLPPQDIDELQNMPEKSGVKNDMDQMTSQLSGMNKSGALNSGKSCSKKLKDMADRLGSTKEKMQLKMKKEIAEAIRKSLYDVFNLSDTQEGLFQQVEGLERADMELRTLARDQQNLKGGATRVAEDLDSLAQKTIFIDSDTRRFMALSVAGMDEATRNLEERKQDKVLDEQNEAIYDLNVTARKLMQALNDAQKSCSGSGMEQMFEQMQKMCNKQSGINQETEQLGMCNKPGGGTQLSLSEQAAMQRLAAEQDAVRKSLGELEKEFGNRSEVLGRLDNLGEDMKKVVGDFERLQVDQSTIERQKNILSRLLDAEKSMRERDYSKQRRAEVGEDVSRPSPKELPYDFSQPGQVAKDDLSKFLEEAYPKEYEQLIKNYFKALSEERMKK
jgi:hypothetical protein